MRTTVNIDEQVLARAKDDARAAGVTLGEFIEQALQRPTPERPEEIEFPALPTFAGTFSIPIDRMTNAEVQDLLDQDVPLDKLR